MSPRISNGQNGHGGPPAARYPSEDTRPTSPKELSGWYAYAFAAEVYVICGISSFIPILLETLARQNGVLLSDGKTPCGSSDQKPPNDPSDGQCIVRILGKNINTASFTMYTFSIGVLLQALLVVSISSAADHGKYRKRLLLAFGWVGSLAVMLYILVSKGLYLLGALLAIVSNVSFGASYVLLNSFLPLLVRHHPTVLHLGLAAYAPDLSRSTENIETQPLNDAAHAGDDTHSQAHDPTEALLSEPHRQEEERDRPVLTYEDHTSLELDLSTQISAKGVGIGYLAGLFVQCASILILIGMGNSTWALRLVLLAIGVWWAVFTIPAALWLRPRPGPPMPAASAQKRMPVWIAYTVHAWTRLFQTVRLARRLLDLVLFLAAWFLLADAVATSTSTAILFAKTQLHMQPWALALINVISTMFGVVGAFSWSWISRRLGLRPHQTILACIGLFELIPLYGLLGYLPCVQSWGVFGLQQPWEMYPLAAVYGFALGGLSSYCRSLYGELIPPGSEAAFYALYAITDKGSSVFGPAVVGAIIGASGQVRPAFWFLACLIGIPAPLIWFVNVERGKREGEKLVDVIEGFTRRAQLLAS